MSLLVGIHTKTHTHTKTHRHTPWRHKDTHQIRIQKLLVRSLRSPDSWWALHAPRGTGKGRSPADQHPLTLSLSHVRPSASLSPTLDLSLTLSSLNLSHTSQAPVIAAEPLRDAYRIMMLTVALMFELASGRAFGGCLPQHDAYRGIDVQTPPVLAGAGSAGKQIRKPRGGLLASR